MKKLPNAIAAMLISTGFTGAAQAAEPLSLETINPNAMVQVLLTQIDKAIGTASPKTAYAKADDFSIMCLGEIKQEGINLFDSDSQPALHEPLIPEIVKFATNPDAKDKETQQKIRAILETRKDLAYLEFVSVGSADANQINAYFTDTWKSTPIDVYKMGASTRDGSMRTTLLMDRATLEKFAAANSAEIQKVSDAYAKDSFSYSYSNCGPKPNPQ